MNKPPAIDIHIGQRRRAPVVCPHCGVADFGYAYSAPVPGWFGFVTWRYKCQHMGYGDALRWAAANAKSWDESARATFALAAHDWSLQLYGTPPVAGDQRMIAYWNSSLRRHLHLVK